MSTLFGQWRRNQNYSPNQRRTLNRMRRARNNPGAPGTPRAQLFHFTRNLNQVTRKRSRGSCESRSRSGSRSGTRKKGKSSH